MAEEQQQQESSVQERSYESLVGDKDLTDGLFFVLKDLDIDVDYEDKKGIIDSFLTRKRFFENNLVAAPVAKSAIDDMDNDSKTILGYALKETDKLPTFGEGAAPLGKKIADYGLAGITDPTNLFSAVAAAFTLGAGGAASLAAKEAAKQGVRKYLKSKIKAAVSKPALASYAVEGTVAGTGGAATNVINQKIRQEVGLRDKEDGIDLTEAATQGIIEGVASPVIGVLGNVAGGGTYQLGKASGRKVIELFPDAQKEGLESGVAWLERNLLPAGGVSDTQRRLVERQSGQAMSFKNRAEDLTDSFNDVLKRDFTEADITGIKKDDAKGILAEESLINKALQGDANSLALVQNKSQEARNLIDDFFNLRNEAFDFAKNSSVNKKILGIFDKDPNYVRNVPEKYAVTKRTESYKDFIKRNPDIKSELRRAMLLDPENSNWKKFTDKYIQVDSEGVAKEALDNTKVDKIVDEAAKSLYAPTRKLRKETGAFEKRKEDLSPTLKKFIGYNNIPGLRIAETINGIVDTASRTNVARDIIGDATRRGVAVTVDKAAKNPEAVAKQSLGGEDVMPITGSFQKISKGEKEDAVMRLPFDTIDDSLKNVYITKTEGQKLKELFDEGFASDIYKRDDVIGTVVRTFSGVQGLSKAGKTIYSPLAHARNIVGAAGYAITSGNLKGLIDGAKYLSGLSKESKQDIIKEYTELGIRGSNIDLNQVLKRFGDISDKVDDGGIIERLVKSGGLAAFGKPGTKAAKVAQEFYGGVDDFFKGASVFANEKRKASKLFNSFSKKQQAAKLAEFDQTFNAGRGTSTAKDYIKEIASQKTLNLTPVYGRIPKILENLRAFPVIGSFTAYPAERIRNTYQIFKIGTDELREGFETGNKELTKQGISRLAQWSAAQGALYTGAYAMNESNGFGDVIDGMRNFLPDWEKNGALVVTGKDKDGNYKYVDLTYIHPDSQFQNALVPIILKAARGEDVSKDLDESVINSFKELVDPYVDPSLAFEFSNNMYEFVTTGEERNLLKALTAVEPGYLNFLKDMARDADAFDKFGQAGRDAEAALFPEVFGTQDSKAEGLSELAARSGLPFIEGLIPIPGAKEKVFNPKKTMAFAISNINRNYKSDRSKFFKNLVNDLADPRTEIDTVSILQDYDEVLNQQFVAQQAFLNLYRDMEKVIGKKETFEITKSLKDSSGSILPSQKSLASILNRERFDPSTVSNKANEFNALDRELIRKTGMSYRNNLNTLRRELLALEKFYKNINLNAEPPDLEIEAN